MTPKDKAIGLYCKYIDAYNDRNLQVIDYKFAKRCALIAVDEIINTHLLSEKDIFGIHPVDYWQEVKKEIEAL